MRFEYFVPKTFDTFVQKCFSLLESRNLGVVLFPSKTDKIWRAEQLIQDYKPPIHLLKIDILADSIEHPDDVEDAIRWHCKNKKYQELGILIPNAEVFIHEKKFNVINSIVSLQRKKNYHFILFFDIDITHPSFSSKLIDTSLYANILYYPLYKKIDQYEFINDTEKEFSITIPSKVKERIIQECGGHTWLLKQALRSLHNNPDQNVSQLFNTEEMKIRLGQIYSSFLESECDVLYSIIKKQPINGYIEKHSYEYLKKMGLIAHHKITVPLIEKFIEENHPKISIEITNKKITLNNVTIDSSFSTKEKRVLKVLLESKNTLIPRDHIANAIWPQHAEDTYSDWAVDRIISRLRNKLVSVGLSKNLIKTVRHKGYILVN